jgi:hypothetical protein
MRLYEGNTWYVILRSLTRLTVRHTEYLGTPVHVPITNEMKPWSETRVNRQFTGVLWLSALRSIGLSGECAVCLPAVRLKAAACG